MFHSETRVTIAAYGEHWGEEIEIYICERFSKKKMFLFENSKIISQKAALDCQS
jgi:hypothetical protein